MSVKAGMVGITNHFATLTDPRIARTRCHDLIDILVVAVCGTICGCDSWEDLVRYGKSKRKWLRKFIRLRNGIPSADTFARVFQRLNPDEFVRCMSSWVDSLRVNVTDEIVAIDGKTSRGSGNASKGGRPLHLVRAWACENRLVLGQQACEEKSNEITAIPKLLELIELSGAIVTIDAMGCQTEIVAKIRERGADYVLPVKDNQPGLREKIARIFETELEREAEGGRPKFRQHATHEQRHGRIEDRRYYVLSAPEELKAGRRWTDIRSLGMIIRRRIIDGKETLEVHYYISSLAPNARRFARAVRAHWGIENKLHWMLDVNFADDASQIHKGSSPQIAAMLRDLALMILQHDTQFKESIRGKRKMAGWSNETLESILRQSTAI